MFKNLVFIPFFILFLSACTSKVTIDNPTPDDITVSVNGTEYEIPAYDQKEVDLKNAPASIIAKDLEGNELLNEIVLITGDGILNVTRSLYIIWTDLYCQPDEFDTYKSKLNLKDLVVVNDKEYEMVDFELTEDVFISKKWDYNLNESFPDSVDLKNIFSIKSKVYRPDDLEAEFGYLGDLDFTESEDKDVKAFMDSLRQFFNAGQEEVYEEQE